MFKWGGTLDSSEKKAEKEMFSRTWMSIVHPPKIEALVFSGRLNSLCPVPCKHQRHIMVQKLTCCRILWIGFEVSHESGILAASLVNNCLEWCNIILLLWDQVLAFKMDLKTNYIR
jgi:hypothetical protein